MINIYLCNLSIKCKFELVQVVSERNRFCGNRYRTFQALGIYIHMWSWIRALFITGYKLPLALSSASPRVYSTWVKQFLINRISSRVAFWSKVRWVSYLQVLPNLGSIVLCIWGRILLLNIIKSIPLKHDIKYIKKAIHFSIIFHYSLFIHTQWPQIFSIEYWQ